MPVGELQALLNGLLVDSWDAAKWLNLKPATLRNPKNKYYKYSIKLGQYRYWRRVDLKMFSPEFETYEQAQIAGWVRINPNKTVIHHNGVSIKCRDITSYARDGVDYGGMLAIIGVDGTELARSSEVFIDGKYSQYFRGDEVQQAIAASIQGKQL